MYVFCHLCVEIPVFHSSTFERRFTMQSHSQQQAPAPAAQQEVDTDIVEILIWNQEFWKRTWWLNGQHLYKASLISSWPCCITRVLVHKKHLIYLIFLCKFIQPTSSAWQKNELQWGQFWDFCFFHLFFVFDKRKKSTAFSRQSNLTHINGEFCKLIPLEQLYIILFTLYVVKLTISVFALF